MVKRLLGGLLVLGLAVPVWATDYTLNFTTNAAQDAILVRSYTDKAIELVSGGATSVPGCVITDLGEDGKTVVCNPTVPMIQGYVRDYVVVPWFQTEKRRIQSGELAELIRKYGNLSDAAITTIKQAAEIQ